MAGASYMTLKKKLNAAYTKTTTQQCAKFLSIVSLGDRDPEHLLSYMKGLLPGEADGQLYRHIWMNVLPETIHEAVTADEGDLDAIAVKATKLMQERTGSKDQVNAVGGPSDSRPESYDMDVVSAGKSSKGKKGYVCANHLQFAGNCYRCFDPDQCLLRNSIACHPSNSSSSSGYKMSGNAGAGRQ